MEGAAVTPLPGAGAVSRPPSFDLQFFAQERTEPATPKKRQKVRSEGRVCMSRDLTAAVEILTGLVALLLLGPFTYGLLSDFVQGSIRFMGDAVLLREGWFALLSFEAVRNYFYSWLPLGVSVAVLAVAVVVWQVGWAVTGEPFKVNLDRLNPISGMKKIVSLRSLVELIKGLLKAAVFAVVIYAAIRDYLPASLRAMQFPLGHGGASFWDMLWSLAMRLAAMLLVMALIDYLYQRWEFERSIRMSRQEIKEEYRQMEGDPQIKSKIRQKQRELAKKRMMASVPKADVVITNPTTLAVALVYDRELMGAPQVVAKGRGIVAQKIRDLARAHGVPVVENRPLAWALFEGVEIGEEISEDLYRGVAEILAMVYRLRAG